MDYKKSKAPVNTVTRNIMDLCKDTGNIYEVSPLLASALTRFHSKSRTTCRRNWPSSLPTTTRWRKYSKTVSR